MDHKQSEYVTAYYLRLSEDDRDFAEDQLESNSIQSQRNLLDDFIGNDEALKQGKKKEFIDDGYSGTNFAGVR